ncbi:MAG: flagellar motor switch protein FliG [Candidatus Kapabacteria bacterium]|nr:flagellar motor switch protein FliG [Candidatus Kapabacteria bacterium]
MKREKEIKYESLSSKQKVALLLMSLDVDASARVFKDISQDDVEYISMEITNLRSISPVIVNKVIEEFYTMMVGQQSMLEGGIDYARNILEKSFGTEKAREIIERIKVLTTVRGFDILKKADPQQLASFLSKEHPQTIALLLSHLPTDHSADVLGEFSEDLRADVLMRIAGIGKVSPAVVQQIEQVVDQIAEQTISQNMSMAGGAQIVANILNKSTVATAKSLMEQIEGKDPNLATDIKRLMFLFDDIIMVDDRGIQRILRDVDKRDLTLAMKASDEKIRAKIFKNMSERASQVIKEELEFMGPIKLKEVEAAQMRIVDVIKRLEEQDEISIGGRGKEDVFV